MASISNKADLPPTYTKFPPLNDLTSLLQKNEHFTLTRTKEGLHLQNIEGNFTFLTITTDHPHSTKNDVQVTNFVSGTTSETILKMEGSQEKTSEGVNRSTIRVYNKTDLIIGTIQKNEGTEGSTVMEVSDPSNEKIFRVEGGQRKYKFIKKIDGFETGRIWERNEKIQFKIPAPLPIQFKSLLIVAANILCQENLLETMVAIDMISAAPPTYDATKVNFLETHFGRILYWSCWGLSAVFLIILIVFVFVIWVK